MKVPAYRVLTNCEPASQRVMRVEPASHASHHVSHARQMLVPSPFSFLRLLAAFGYLARVFAILALLSISFCYLPSSFSSFVKINYVICYYFSRVFNRWHGGNRETEDKTTLNRHYTCATSASPQSRFRNEKVQKFKGKRIHFLANHKQFDFF